MCYRTLATGTYTLYFHSPDAVFSYALTGSKLSSALRQLGHNHSDNDIWWRREKMTWVQKMALVQEALS
jgi:hypothetical protein